MQGSISNEINKKKKNLKDMKSQNKTKEELILFDIIVDILALDGVYYLFRASLSRNFTVKIHLNISTVTMGLTSLIGKQTKSKRSG